MHINVWCGVIKCARKEATRARALSKGLRRREHMLRMRVRT